MIHRQSVAVIFGGRSCEHEVSIKSACSILNQLDQARFQALPIYIDRAGAWWLFPLSPQAFTPDVFGNTDMARRCLLSPDPSLGLRTVPDFEPVPCDVCFPIIHGTQGEDGVLQGLLELSGLPYVGSGVAGSAMAMNKILMKSLFAEAQIPTADYVAFDINQWAEQSTTLLEQCQSLAFPLFIKPASAGSSVGITRVTEGSNQLNEAIDYALKFDQQVLVESGIAPARELEVAVLGNDELEVSCVGEILPLDGFYDYESKYLNDTAGLEYPAQLTDLETQQLQQLAKQAYRALGLSGLARVDFLLNTDTHQLSVLEVNTLPGFTEISMYPKLWQSSGLPYQDLLTRLLELGIERHQKKTQQQTDFADELAALQSGAH